ncbi:MAG: PKD domain-containing protein [Bacteroidota bacterium]
MNLFTKSLVMGASAVLIGSAAYAQSTCTASFTYTVTGLTLNVTSTSTGVSGNTQYAWTWGDATNGTGATASHTYSGPGTYSVCLLITDFTTCADSACINVVIGSSGIEDFSKTLLTMNVSPNPSNSQAVIGYSSTAEGEVLLEAYDMLGNKVAVLEKESKPAGSYEARFDTQGLPEGIYFVKLRVNGREAVTKLTVLH